MPLITRKLTLEDLPSPPKGKTGWPWTQQRKKLSQQMPDGSYWPRISIITPSYNQGKFLEATIRSVLLQGYPNLEYIIIDGGSTDESVEIIKKYEKYLHFWVSEKDNGQADAVNKGLEKSTGEILGWINSDDIYLKGAFKKVITAFNAHDDCAFLHGNRIMIDESGSVTGWCNLPKFSAKKPYSICSETAFWKRSIMHEVGLLNTNLKFAMDLEFFGRIYQRGKFIKLDEYLGGFRLHSLSKSSTISHIGEEETIKIWHELFNSEPPIRTIKTSALRLLLELVRHPIIIGFPYLSYKLKKFYSY